MPVRMAGTVQDHLYRVTDDGTELASRAPGTSMAPATTPSWFAGTEATSMAAGHGLPGTVLATGRPEWAVIELAHPLRLNVVAEGVETAEDAETLVSYGSDEAQGFYSASCSALRAWPELGARSVPASAQV
jgi:hypothetical protein